MKDLIIVESPAKARTIKNFLGSKYEVIASKGHIRDLPKHTFGIDVKEHSFHPQYTIDKDHIEIVNKIKLANKNAKTTYIATDEDREGEAIGYHITQALEQPYNKFPRIVFHEITKNAIEHSLKHPRTLDMNRVNAQQARRLLDRIVGFKLSWLISSKIQRGLSAGRVQSAALKIIVDREREIRAFKPTIYYVINAIFNGIESELIYFDKKLEKLSIQDANVAEDMLLFIKKQQFFIKDIITKTKKTPTPPPFMTSTLQQTASSVLGFSPSKTMSIAQRLYEGVETHNGTMGVITYMRTDSLNIAKEAQNEARIYIEKQYGKEYVPQKPKIYTNKSKSAQEAHEAIRPTNLDFSLDVAKNYLKIDELKLYTLIFHRFLASQSVDAVFEIQNIIFAPHNEEHSIEFKASGKRLTFNGFYKITGVEDKDKLLPTCKKGENVTLDNLTSTQKSTEAPSRYSEASIIKTIESLGIGRPSTYAPTIALLVARDYVKIDKKQLVPQESAFKVVEMLELHFNEIVDANFSASLEEQLDDIAQEKRDWEVVLWDFYEPFMAKIEAGKANIISQKVIIPTGEMCPKCGKELVMRQSKYGEFIACSGYPKCKYIKPSQKADGENNDSQEDYGLCEKCGKKMVKKRGRNGEFIACSGYPQCKNAKSLQQKSEPKTIDVACPQCGGDIVQRFSKKGMFFGCKNYPKCTFISRFMPIATRCPKCGGAMCEREYRKKHIQECLKCKHRIDA